MTRESSHASTTPDPDPQDARVRSGRPAGQRRRRIARRLLKGVAVLVALVVLGAAVLLGLLWGEHRTAMTLPAPTGPFPVARAEYDWVDHSRTDPLAPAADQPRELAVWIWYPAAPTSASRPVDYLPAPWRTSLAGYQGTLMSTFLTRDPALVHAHSIENATVAPTRPTYPVVLMRSGIGALATDYTTLAEDLASHGYVVVGMDAPYSTSVVVFPDGRVVTRTDAGHPSDANLPAAKQNRLTDNLITLWSADTRFVLDRLTQLDDADPTGLFTHRLDLGAVGIFGHSFGGATAAQFCHDDSRCRAGIDIDGALQGSVVHEGLQRPFLFLTGNHGDPSDPVNRAALAGIQAVYRSIPADERFWVSVRGTGHFNFSDQSLLKDGTLSRLAGMTGSINQRRGLTVTASCIQQFFDTYLRRHPGGFPGNLTQRYPEAQLDHARIP